jgi:hypothetical protein
MDIKKAIGLGFVLGIIFGVAIHNFALGIVIGIALGAGLTAYTRRSSGPVPPTPGRGAPNPDTANQDLTDRRH